MEEKKTVTIFVNGTEDKVDKDKVTYAEVVTLAFPDFPQHPERTYSVTYKKGPNEKPEGTLSPGGSVGVKNGMEFRVSFTGQS
jgi:hypothetical protein